MTPRVDKVYEYASLDEYSLADRIKIRTLDFFFYLVVRAIGLTLRFEVEGWEHYDAVIASGKHAIWPSWHNRIFLYAIFFRNRGITVITSKSRDGEYISRSIQRLGFGAIRGSSSRGGTRVIIEAKKAMQRGIEIGFTADGPRGPRYEAKPGAVYLAKLTGNPLLPFLIEPKSCWVLKTWDRLMIPKPFSRAKLFVSEPIIVPEDADESDIEHRVVELQHSLDDLVERGREWSRVVG